MSQEITITRFVHKCGHLGPQQAISKESIPRACDRAMAHKCASCSSGQKKNFVLSLFSRRQAL